MTTQKLLTRKDIANLLGISVRSFARNEKKLGLQKFRACVNGRVVFYQSWRALPHLQSLGLIAK